MTRQDWIEAGWAGLAIAALCIFAIAAGAAGYHGVG